jgi:hypothetical protein
MSLAKHLKVGPDLAKCWISGHDVDPDVIEALYASSEKFSFTACTRCHSPLKIEKEDDETFIVSLRQSIEG